MATVAKKTLKSVFTPVEIRAFVAMFNEQTHAINIIELFKKSDDELLTIVADMIVSHEVEAESIFLSGIEPRKIAYMQLLHRNPKAVFDASTMVADEEETVAVEDPEDPEGEVQMATPRPVTTPRPAAVTPTAAAPRPATPAAATPAAAAPRPVTPAAAAPAAAALRPAAPGALRPQPVAAKPGAPAVTVKPAGAVSPAATPAAAVKEPEATGISIDDVKAVLQEALIPLYEKIAGVEARLEGISEATANAASGDLDAIAKDTRTLLVLALGEQLRKLGYVDNADTVAMLTQIVDADYTDPSAVVESLLPVELYQSEPAADGQ